jgi:hypothetical protein
MSDDPATPGGGEGAEGFVQLLSSTGFSRGWFNSGATDVGAGDPAGGESKQDTRAAVGDGC